MQFVGYNQQMTALEWFSFECRKTKTKVIDPMHKWRLDLNNNT